MLIRKCLVLAAASLAMFIANGFPYNMTVLYVEFLEEFGKSKAETALVQTICASVTMIGGTPAGMLISRYGSKKAGMVAGFLTSIGIMISYFATSLIYLDIAIGLFTGVGASLTVIAGPTSVGRTFKGAQKHFALSFISFFVSISGLTFPLALNFLIDNYTWRGCLLIIGGFALNLMPLSAVYEGRTVNHECSKVVDREKTPLLNKQYFGFDNKQLQSNKFDKKTTFSTETSSLIKGQIESVSRGTMLNNIESQLYLGFTENTTDKSVVHSESTVRRKIKKILGNRMFLFHFLGNVIGGVAVNSIDIFLVDFMEWKNFTKLESVQLYTFMYVGCSLTSLSIAVAEQIPFINVHAMQIVNTFICTVCVFLLPVAVTYTQHVFITVLYGVGMGGILSWKVIGTMKIVGVDLYAEALGLICTSLGVGGIIGGPVAGWIFDFTGGYYFTFFGAGVCVFLSCLCYIGVFLINKGIICSRIPTELIR